MDGVSHNSDAASASTSSNLGGPGLFQCSSCKRQYKRVDHLARHVRSHTQSKPYKCRICPKAFARGDLLKRHVVGHPAVGEVRDGDNNQQLTRNAQDAPSRVTTACRACAECHLRCTESKPCDRCTKKGIECAWNQSMELRSIASTQPSQESELTENSTQRFDGDPSPTQTAEVDESRVQGIVNLQFTDMAQNTQLVPPSGTNSETLVNADTCALPDLNLLSGQLTPMDGLHFDMSPDMDFGDVDTQFLSSYNVNVPFEYATNATFNHDPDTVSSRKDVSVADASVARRSRAFSNSHWRFQPNAYDHGGAEEPNLSLPSISDDAASPESRVTLERPIVSAIMKTAARDKILTLIVNNCRPENLPGIVASFPSIELLSTLLQYNLGSSVVRSHSFIHVATFNPNEKKAELLASLAAAGAVLTSDPTLMKLGYAMQECVRIATPRLWENDNSMIRDLELAQAWLVNLEVGLWSGCSRKVEIAESFLQPLLTMLRRNLRFRRSGYPDFNLRGDEDHESLNEKWHTWVQQESFKRLVFRVLQHDTDSSMALLTNPLISYAEVQLPLPSSHDLWSASNPEQWKTVFLSQAHIPPIALGDCLDDPELISKGQTPAQVATNSLACLSVAWRLSWEYLQLSTLRTNGPRRWNGLLIESRREELLKLLDNFRICMGFPSPEDQDIVMRIEVIHLHIYMPFEKIQIFAGMEGPEQARAVYPVIVDWVRAETARKAVWHAGQIIRAAKSLPYTRIQGPIAIIIYHASLALWVYGLLSEDVAAPHPFSTLEPAKNVQLDGKDDIILQRFLQLGRGSPCIRGVPDSDDHNGGLEEVCLYHPDEVMKTIAGIMRVNHHGNTRPPLIENLIQLISELQKSCGDVAK